MRYSLITIAAVAVAGCAMSTGIMPAGPDTYMLSKIMPQSEAGR
jgi:hypothetical protein